MKLTTQKTTDTFRGAIRWDVLLDGDPIGWASRTGKGERCWINSDEDRAYYLTRASAVHGLLLSRKRSEPHG